MDPTIQRINCDNLQFVEQRLDDYLADPSSVSDSWRELFADVGCSSAAAAHPPRCPRRSVFNPASSNGITAEENLDSAQLQDRLDQIICAYRVRGHLAAQCDPLGMAREEPVELSPEHYKFSEADLYRPCAAMASEDGNEQSLGDIIQRLQETYCRYIGVQYMHIEDLAERHWLQDRMEASNNRIALSRHEQVRILTRLTDAVIFEQFVRKKYIGSKTFSLEGAESLIPLLDLAIEKAGRQNIAEIVLGMAHRGRLNVLANIIGKRPLEIFREFNDPSPELHRGRGDVMYHLGFSGDWTTERGHDVHLSLCFNPSHLEFVDPVALGRMRAKQDRANDESRSRGMALLIHGDASFAGEGIVQETLNLSQLAGYSTGGTLHVVVNNQLGFTTPRSEGRSTTYPTDVARMLKIPIFHVNGERPEAVAQAVELAMDFRAEFRRDAIIDMFCYRRWGHNQGDEPSFTQPAMYKAIEHRESVRDDYLKHLVELGDVSPQDGNEIAEERQEELRKQFQQARENTFEQTHYSLSGVWKGYLGGHEPEDDIPNTGVDANRLSELLLKLTEIPDDFRLHRKLKRSIQRRRDMAAGEAPLDWSAAEALAIATLAIEGHPVRLSGQDTARGTFSQRHAILHDVVDGSRYAIFGHLSADQARVDVINSPLCEAGALGFEYGYSLDCPEGLVAWEAQYGDFANAAQVIIDQFIASAEDKWRRLSGLVLLLPHGFEGMGPEHSSCRLGRFLGLGAEDNLQIVSPSTPAQYFHVLRRQVKRRWRKPLVVLTPKSLLRNRRATSCLDELASEAFQRILSDGNSTRAKRVLLCCGKVYYDLLEYREEHDRSDVAIIRVEQLYPFDDGMLGEALAAFVNDTDVMWVQEEPENMGAWRYWCARFREGMFGHPFDVVARPASASPATGSKESHKREQRELVASAFAD